jgi:hypothetical protein
MSLESSHQSNIVSEQKSICAFDIGIKNLSYCILNKKGDINIVDDWELIDLRSSRPACIGILKKNGVVCSKPADLYHKTDNTIFYCTKHSKQYIPKNFDVTNCKNPKLCEYGGDKSCSKKGTQIVTEKNYCATHFKKLQNEFLKQNKLCKMKSMGCMKEPLYDLGTHMYDALDKRPSIMKVDKIIIENQPSLTNPTMKSISVLLLSYFIMKKHPDVEFISPAGKLKVNEQLTKTILSKCISKSVKYAITKELGVKYTEKILENFENTSALNEKLLSSKKKDDLCDAFLHAYYHMYGCGGLKSAEFIDKTTKYFDEKIKNKKSKKELTKEIIKLDL